MRNHHSQSNHHRRRRRRGFLCKIVWVRIFIVLVAVFVVAWESSMIGSFGNDEAATVQKKPQPKRKPKDAHQGRLPTTHEEERRKKKEGWIMPGSARVPCVSKRTTETIKLLFTKKTASARRCIVVAGYCHCWLSQDWID